MALRNIIRCMSSISISSNTRTLQTKLPLLAKYPAVGSLHSNVSLQNTTLSKQLAGYNVQNSTFSTLCSNQNFLKPSLINRSDVQLVCNSKRTITRISKNKGKMKTARMVIQRFRRLGNGLWLRAQCRRQRKLYMVMYRGRGLTAIYKKKRLVLCNQWQSRHLDKMVAPIWKTQKWYVEDPYKGYTEESLHYYHPADLPENLEATKLPQDWGKYGLNRSKSGDARRKNRKVWNYGALKSNRQKPVPDAKNMRFMHY